MEPTLEEIKELLKKLIAAWIDTNLKIEEDSISYDFLLKNWKRPFLSYKMYTMSESLNCYYYNGTYLIFNFDHRQPSYFYMFSETGFLNYLAEQASG